MFCVKTSRMVLNIFLPAIPLSALCHEHFIRILYAIMLIHIVLKDKLIIY